MQEQGERHDRWLVPPAALAVHLCIGMAYGFSVFWLPLTRAIGIEAPVNCPTMTLPQALVTTTCDWRVRDLIWIYTLFFLFLGASAALFGGWLERVGPRRAALVATACWCGGMLLTALGVYIHQLWLMWLGGGVIGGIGLGLGYISPVSTLIKWFPDRRGMATGMAIMGFGGGAMIGGPLAERLMQHFAGPAGVGVWQTLVTMAAIYAVFMTGGALSYRRPAPGWKPAGWEPPAAADAGDWHVALSDAHRTRQFWLLWAVLLLNVSAGIGLIGIASPLLQEMLGGRLFGQPEVPFSAFDDSQRVLAASTGAGFVGLLSLFNIGGRFFWASVSDRIGRRATYAAFFLLGLAAFIAAPLAAGLGSVGGFVALMCLIASMYGGGFATIPAYLADLFGVRFVGAIHGRLLTAWSAAGIGGPILVTWLADRGRSAGLTGADLYRPVFWTMAGLLALGFLCNLLIGAVHPAFRQHAEAEQGDGGLAKSVAAAPHSTAKRLLAWAAVLLPLGWGVAMTLAKSVALFG